MTNPSKIKIPIAIIPPKNNSDEMYNLHTHNAGAYRAQAINCRTAHAFSAAAGFADSIPPVASQLNSMRIAARFCLTVGAAPASCST